MDNPRPVKRARKDDDPDAQDHSIFIADGHSKKQKSKQPLSCQECRRLKLKCDRVFPCKSCTKRGCADICPQGALVSGKGTRFILANTEQLHAKISEMSERIRVLEEALSKNHGVQSHPLLAPDLLLIKSSLPLYGEAQTGSHSPPPAADSQAQLPQDYISSDQVALPSDVIHLSQQFPLVDGVSPPSNLALRGRIRNMLPSQADTSYLWEQVKRNALWQYNPHSDETFMPNLMHHVYHSPTGELSSHRLSLLFMILAVGCLVDLNQPGDSPEAERYHHLARAALTETPVMEETSADGIVALFYMTWYLLMFSDKKKAASYAWGLMGLNARLAQSLNLHRETVKTKVIPEEVENRRNLFWELLYLDARLSLSLGMPPSLFEAHTQCQRPSYYVTPGYPSYDPLHHYQEWKHSCYIHCLHPVLSLTSNLNADYCSVTDLDSKIRDFYTPSIFHQSSRSDSGGHGHHASNDFLPRSLTMQQASAEAAIETALLQLHRTYFTRALSTPEEPFNRSHKYAPSVVAVFLSATRMIAVVERVFKEEPELSGRILWYWSNAFSAAIALCLLVCRAPFACLSPASLQELERAVGLFRDAKDLCPRALQVYPMLETMVEKANHTFARWSTGQNVSHLVLKHTTDAPRQATITDRGSSARQAALEYAQNQALVSGSPAPPIPLPQIQSLASAAHSPTPPMTDGFTRAHPVLSQCIAEAHQRAQHLFPLRKPCLCSVEVQSQCPPTHSWAPPPRLDGPTHNRTPILPDLYVTKVPRGVMKTNEHHQQQNAQALHGGNASPAKVHTSYQTQQSSASSSSSRMTAVMENLNFDFGAMGGNNEQHWMAFF